MSRDFNRAEKIPYDTELADLSSANRLSVYPGSYNHTF